MAHSDLPPAWRRRDLVLALGLALCLGAQAAPGGETPVASAKEGGLLFHAERGDSTVFLYGTIHLGAESFYPLSPRVLRPLRQAQALAVEVDLLAADLSQVFRRYGTLPTGTASLSIVGSNAQRIDPLLRAAQIDPMFARRFKPDVLASTLGALSAAELGFSTQYAVDSFLLGFARAAGIPVVELEGLAMQLTMNDTLPAARRQAFLDDALDGLASGRTTRMAARIVRAWQQHDLDLLDLSDEPGTSQTHNKAFLEQMAERNATMSQRIGTLGATYQRMFVAVGVLHLPSPQGLPNLLGRQGYRVVRLM